MTTRAQEDKRRSSSATSKTEAMRGVWIHVGKEGPEMKGNK